MSVGSLSGVDGGGGLPVEVEAEPSAVFLSNLPVHCLYSVLVRGPLIVVVEAKYVLRHH